MCLSRKKVGLLPLLIVNSSHTHSIHIQHSSSQNENGTATSACVCAICLDDFALLVPNIRLCMSVSQRIRPIAYLGIGSCRQQIICFWCFVSLWRSQEIFRRSAISPGTGTANEIRSVRQSNECRIQFEGILLSSVLTLCAHYFNCSTLKISFDLSGCWFNKYGLQHINGPAAIFDLRVI